MRNVLVVIFALLSSVCIGNSQDLELLSGNPQWMYSTYMNGALIGAEPNVLIDDDRFGLLEKDGMTYHLLYQIDRLDTDNGDVLFVPFEPLGVREEHGKVYVLSDDFRKQVARLSQYDMDEVQIPYLQTSESEFLLYDFTLEEGDQYPTSSAYDGIYVEKVETVVTDDARVRKLFTLTNGLQIMEGVGCLNSRNGDFLYYLYPQEVWKHNNDSFYNRLYEYKKNGALIYNESVSSEYFPEGTKWTEIRLDTLKYDSWYSKVGDEWVPNFETVEYYVKGEYSGQYGDRYKCVYTSGPEWTDSLTLMINEDVTEYDSIIRVTTPNLVDELLPGTAYQMKWNIGKELYYRDITASNITDLPSAPQLYGIIEEIKEGDFGGVRPLKYVDLDDVRIIHGIGVTEWKDGECLFGQINPYMNNKEGLSEKRHYRSMLVHFERNGEVLYNVWPKKEGSYRPFVEDGKTWNYMQKTLENGGWHETPYSYVVRGDTVVDGKAYKNLYLQKGGTEQLAFMMRQEGSKVFKLKPGQEEEKLFFDFGREDIGVVYQLPYEEDDMETASWMIHAIDTIQVSDRLYRRYCCYQTDELEPGQSTIEEGLYTQKDYWVEGIGSAKMGVESYGTVVMPETPSGVKCTFVSCYENGECIFTADDFYPQTSTKPDDEKDYRPLVEEGKHWTYDDFMPMRPAEYDHYYYYDLRGDTLIAGQQCLKMYSENLMNNSEIKYQGSLFEENKKVYYFSPGKEKAELLYDFDCVVGDTLHVWAGDLVVKDIQTEDNGGIAIRKYTLCQAGEDKDDEWSDFFWIEGVGASTDFFSMMPYPGNYNTLNACELNGEKLYQTIKKDPTEEGYHKMGIEGKRWNYIHYYIDNDGEHFDPYWYVVKGDTIIRRTNYKILYYQDEKTERPVCLLREVGREVFKCDFGDNSYDMPLGTSFFHFGRDDFGRVFSWKAKMEVGNTNWMVYNVDTIKVNNRFFRRYTCLQKYSEEGQALTTIEDGDDVWHDIWVEGIGSASSGIEDQKPNHEPPVRTTSDYTYFVSCYENGECIFTADDFNAQTSTKPDDEIAYRPFVEDGKVWKVGTASGNPVQVVDYYYFDGDTIIDGKICKKMMCQQVVSPNHPDYAAMSQIPSLRCVGAWYEEDKKVYMYNEINQLGMMYDFSLEANETLLFDNYPYVIGPKRTGGLNGFKGIYRDVMWRGNEDPYYCTTWLEGVGGIDGPTVNVYYGKEYWAFTLMSCTVGDEVIYLNDEYEDGATPAEARKKRFDFTHTIKIRPKVPIKRETRTSDEQLSLYGEYNDLQLGIHLEPLDEAYKVSIADESGKVVYEKAVNAGNIVGLSIDISAYTKGRYTVTVENSSEAFTGEFEAQTTGIEENVKIEKLKNVSIYNLQGQRLSSLQKGLNIVNGRKISVK